MIRLALSSAFMFNVTFMDPASIIATPPFWIFATKFLPVEYTKDVFSVIPRDALETVLPEVRSIL